MKKKILLIVLIYGIFSTGYAQETEKVQPTRETDIYRHYTGVIGDRAVELDLGFGCCLSNFGGSNYYFPGTGESYVLMIYDPGDNGNNFNGRAEASSGSEVTANWEFKILGGSLTGTYKTSDGGIATIDLKEDYTKSSGFSILRIKDTAARILGDGKKFRAEAEYILPRATSEKVEASYINNQIIRFAGGDTTGTDVGKFAELSVRHYIKEFLVLPNPEKNGFWSNVDYFADYSSMVIVYPVYNKDGMLVLRKFGMSMTGGESETLEDSYLCIDAKNRQIWTADDILKKDNGNLQPLLEQKLRAILSINATDDLSAHTLSGKVHVTDNIMVSGNNLKFYYNRGELLKDKYEEVCISISYSELNGLLKNEFVKRMGL